MVYLFRKYCQRDHFFNVLFQPLARPQKYQLMALCLVITCNIIVMYSSGVLKALFCAVYLPSSVRMGSGMLHSLSVKPVIMLIKIF